jgi:hypothetical protein
MFMIANFEEFHSKPLTCIRVNPDILEREYIIIRVNNNIDDLSNFILIDNTFDQSGNITNNHRHLYRFPQAVAMRGDLIFLYTRSGKNELTFDGRGNPIHRVFWGQGNCVWNDIPNEAVQIFQTRPIDFKPLRSLPRPA